MTPMAPRKSLTVVSLSVLVVTFLKNSPAVGGFAAGGACAAAWPANPSPASHTTAIAVAARTRFLENFISKPPNRIVTGYRTKRLYSEASWRGGPSSAKRDIEQRRPFGHPV